MSQSHSLQLDAEFLQVAGPMLAAAAQQPRPALHDVEAHRVSLDTLLTAIGQAAPKHEVTSTTHKIQTRDGASIDVIQVSPKHREQNGAAVLHIHGGGMISSSAAMFVKAGIVPAYAEASGIDFFAVDYRLAPENKLDGLVNDCYDALHWLSSNAASLGVDNKRIGVMGESAGGGLAAGVALQARDTGLAPPLRKQILICPMLDDRNIVRDERLAPTASWTYESNITGWSAVLCKGVPGTDMVNELVKYAVPARVQDLSGLPDTYIDVGQLDIFVDEDLEFVHRLHKAGVQVDFNLHKDLPHAWELFAKDISTGKRINLERILAIQSI